MAGAYRRVGLDGRAEECEAFIHYWSRALWGDPHALFEPAAALLQSEELSALVCGHTHLPGVVDLDGRTYVNAGAWSFGTAGYVEWDGTRFTARDHITGENVGDRHYRWMITGPDRGDFFTWWEAHHRGGLRFVA